MLSELKIRETFRIRLIEALLLISTVGIYLVSLHAPFIYDDIDQIPLNPGIRHLGSVFNVVGSNPRAWRVIMNLTFWLNWKMSGLDTWSYHLMNIGLHLCDALLFKCLLQRLFPRNPRTVLIAFALFLLHPLQSESVAYIMGRISLLECLLFLSVLHLRESSSRFSKPALTALLFISPLFKETAVLLPPLLVAYDFIVKKEPVSTRKAYYFIPWITFLTLVALTNAIAAQERVVGMNLFPAGEYFLTQMAYLLFRIKLLFFSSSQSIIHEYPAFTRQIALQGCAGLMLLVAIILISWRKRKTHPSFAFLGAFFVLALLPVGTFLQFINPFAEYRLYLTNICAFAIMAHLTGLILDRIPTRAFRHATSICVIAFFSFFNFLQNELWADQTRMLRHSAELYPSSYRVQLMLGGTYEAKGEFRKAESAYRRADAINEQFSQKKTMLPKILIMQLYEQEGRWKDARMEIESTPIDALKGRPPLLYYQHYLRILAELGDRNRYDDVAQAGKKLYGADVLKEPGGAVQ